MALPVLAALTGSISAQPGGFGRGRFSEPLMAVLDRNQDGELSEAELKETPQLLRKLDRNRDSRIDREELRAYMFDRAGGQPGQRPGRSAGGPRGGGGPGSPGSSQLERSGLKPGRPAPDVTVYDADGKEFSLKALRGSHTVLVFGCLT